LSLDWSIKIYHIYPKVIVPGSEGWIDGQLHVVDSGRTTEGGLYLQVLWRSSQYKTQREEVKSENRIHDSSVMGSIYQ
jgi:hypothetical protein